ncbi:MAG TPA: DUF11 domain-containing protein [Chloroflexi bacterium]|nr:DUF11 domain-containing protein [Chloroflexota bacterium]
MKQAQSVFYLLSRLVLMGTLAAYSLFPSLLAQAASPERVLDTDMSITMSDTIDPVVTGRPFAYAITVTNNGGTLTSGVVLTDTLPTELDFAFADASQGVCGFSSGTLTCNLGSLAAGASAVVTLTVSANTAGTVSNTASVSANDTELNPGDNTVTEDTTTEAGTSTICYAAADGGDRLVTVDRATWAGTIVGGFGVGNIETIAYWPGTNTLYAANAGDFGVVNVSTGAYTSIGTIGSGDGSQGTVTMDDVDGLTFDPFTGILYGSQREGNADLLIQIDPSTGAIVQDAFGPGVDYREITIIAGLDDVDDIAISSVDGTMYATENNSTGDHIIIVDKTTGNATDVARVTEAGSGTTIDDVEGLGYDALGNFYATTGTASAAAYRNSYYTVDPATAQMTLRSDLSGQGTDYEGTDCLVDGVNSVAGTVFEDLDADGVRDTGENGTSGVTVNLYRDTNGNGQVDPGEPLVATQQTDANGHYSFTMAASGDLVMDIDTATLPANHYLTTDNLEAASFSGFGNLDAQNDFGHAPPVTIGDRIWLDANGDGVQDSDEGGIGDVDVWLDLDGDGIRDAGEPVATTDASGNYLFENVQAGDYTVRVDTSTLPAGLTQTGDPDDVQDNAHTLGTYPGNSYLDVDFGYQGLPVTIGDTIWNDLDGDGVQDSGEGGISGVTVWLDMDGDGVRDADEPSTTTDENGEYLFSGLPAGTYTVTVDTGAGSPLNGATQTYDLDGTGTPNTASVTLAAGETRTDLDFGYQYAALSVGKSSDAGGTVAPGDTITYTIVVRNNTGATHENIVVSDTLPAGTTYVANSTQVTAPAHETVRDEFSAVAYNNNDGTQNWASNWSEENDDGDPAAGKIYIDSGEFVFHGTSDTDVFTATRSANLSGVTAATLTFDFHSRGTLESADTLEIRVNDGAGWVTLDPLSDDGDLDNGGYSRDITAYASASTQIALRVTGFRQTYEYLYIDNVQIAYAVSPVTQAGNAPPTLVAAGDGYSLLAGEVMTVTFQVTVDNPVPAGLGSIDNTVEVTSDQQSSPQQSSTTDDLPDATLGDRLWYDTDGNGVQDGGEDGVAGVTVNLYDPGPDGVIGGGDDVLVASTTTDSNGNYTFADIPADQYYLDFDLPSGYSFTTQNAGGDDALDSDVDASGQTVVFSLTAGETNNDFDAGLTNSQLDYGDLPDSYNRTLLADDGPRHTVGTLTLGPNVDTEPDGQESNTASADNYDDGVTRDMSDNWTNGATVDIDLDLRGSTASGLADVGMWIDWNNDGVFGAGEFYSFSGLNVGMVNTVQITVPDSSTYTVGDDINVRVRAFDPDNLPGGSLDGGDYAGPATNGEVEDYFWEFGPTAITLEDLQAVSGGDWNTALPVAFLGVLLLTGAGLVLRKRYLA